MQPNTIYITVYIAALLAIGVWTKRQRGADEFLIGGRDVGLWSTTASIAAITGGILFVSQAALGFALGLGAMWFWVGTLAGFIAMAVKLGPLKATADAEGQLTIGDMIRANFGNRAATVAASALFIAYLAILIGQFIAGASLFAPLLEISYPSAVLLLGGVTLAYLLLGGYAAVVKTDLLQIIVMVLAVGAVLLRLDLGAFQPEQFDLNSQGTVGSIGAVFVGFFSVLAAADIWQRIFAARGVKVARQATLLGGVIFFGFGLAVTLIGMAAQSAAPESDPSGALYVGLFQLMPPELLGLVVVLVLATIMSTIDTELFYLSSSIAQDFVGSGDDAAAEVVRRRVFIALIGLALFSMGVAIFFADILLLTFALLSLTLAVGPLIFAMFFYRPSTEAAIGSMALGLLTFIGLLLTGMLDVDTTVLTLPGSLLGLGLGEVVHRVRSR